MRLATLVARRVVVAVLLSALYGARAQGDGREPRMGIFTQAGARLDLSLPFVDSKGERGSLESMMIPDRPCILVPIFYRCPRLCGLTLSGVVELVNKLPLVLGRDYSVVAYSFNPEDTVSDASKKRDTMVAGLSSRPTRDDAVRFLVGTSETVTVINEEIGFRVRYADKELEHSSAIFIVSPSGEVQKYFAGVAFDPLKVAVTLKGN